MSKKITLALIFLVFFAVSIKAQKPNISYATPQTIFLNKPITPIKVTNKGGSVPNAVFPSVAKFRSFDGTVDRFVILPSGDIYASVPSAVVRIKADGTYMKIAGGGQYGYADGQGDAARFNEINAIAVDAAGNSYVTDINWRDGLNSRIRKVTPTGLTTTYAKGLAAPSGLAIGADGTIYVAEEVGRITKIAKDGTKTLLAGQEKAGFADGTGAGALFNDPKGICVDKAGNIFVADYGNNLIRKVTPQGVVTTIAGSGIPGTGANFEKGEDGNGRLASFSRPFEIHVDSKGALIVGESNDVIRKITPNGDVFTIKGPYLDEQGNFFYQGLGNKTAIDQDDNIVGYNASYYPFLGLYKIFTTGYSIQPELPQGVKLGPDGGITGTPSELLYKTKYTITASNSAGVSQAKINLEVVLSNDAPVITSFSPVKVVRGQHMSIYGSYFTGTTAVTIGGKPAPYFQVQPNGNTIDVYSPEDADAGDITVTTPYGTARISGFEIVPPPIITAVSPLTGYPGAKITLTGTDFSDIYQITFGGYSASYNVISKTQIEATLGNGGSGDIFIQGAAGTNTFPGFTFIKAPAVSTTVPTSAGAGGTVVIKGADFTNATSVKFGTVEAKSFKVDSPDQITAVVAEGSSNAITITTPAGSFTYNGFTFVSPPVISQVAPLKGGANSQVTIYGTGLKNAQVTIGGVPATVTYSTEYQVAAIVGSGASSGDVVVTTAGGTATAQGFVFVLPPTITSFSPQTAGLGDKVTITGTHFSDATIVQFGGAYTSFKITSPTSIEATIGNGNSGIVTVVTAGGTANLGGFTHKGPIISSFTPTSASNGESVTVIGVNFTGATGVTFGGVPAKSFSVVSATELKAVVSNGKSGAVGVITPFGTAYKDGFQHPGPGIISVNPLYAGAQSVSPVYIYGSNFTGTTSVTFGGVAAISFVVTSASTITAMPPAGASGDVMVSSPKGSDKIAGFVWVQAPSITDFMPKSQGTYGPITVTGTNFTGVTSVTIGDVPCNFTTVSSTSLTVYVAYGASGDLVISTVGGKVKATGFTNISPVIQAISPSIAAVGQTVTITGTNFNNVQSVKFDNINAASFNVISPEKITAVVASGSGSPVTVTTAGGTAFFTDFRLLLPPSIYNISPGKGGEGTLVSINGNNLSNTTDVKIGGTTATIISVEDNLVTVKAGNGSTGSITLTTPAGTITFGSFTWYPAPVITSANPMSANAETTVTLTGKNFDEITEVTFGGEYVQWTPVSSTEITVLPVNGASGDINIKGTGGTASLPGFVFINAPVISSFVKTGDGANATVVINGLNFNKVTEVKFGSVPAKNFTVNSETVITALPGTGATGAITVKAEGGTGSISGYLYNQPPAITSLSMAYGAIGSVITINGNYFNTDATKNVVFFGPSKATVKSVTKTAIQVTVPAGGNGIITVVDTDKRLSAISNIPFNVTNNKGSAIAFANKLDIPFKGPFGAYELEDFDGDGLADIVISHNDSVYVRLHGSDPQLSKSSFSKKVVLITNRQVLYLTVGDVDGDGKKDILAAYGTSIVFLRNTSTGGNVSFDQKTLEAVDGDYQLYLRDMDMDGRPDLVANPYYGVCYPNTTVGSDVSFGKPVLINSTSGATTGLVVSDIDGDGKPEPIRTSSYGATEIYKNNTVPGDINAVDFAPSGINHTGGYYNPEDLLITDLDGDGKTDLIGYSNSYNYLQVFRNVSTGKIDGASFANTLAFQSNFMPYYMSAADMDGDGKTDLVGASNYDVSFMRNQTAGGSIAMAAPVVIVPESKQYVAQIKPVDMDGDGRMDIIVNTPEKASLTIYHNGPIVTPKITAVTPSPAAAGAKITITGKHFDAATVVAFGSKNAKSFEVISHEKIEAILGDGESGLVTVKTPNGTATFAGFAVVDGPAIKSVVAATDGSGLLVITGVNLSTAKNVEIAGVEASAFKVESDTIITATFSPVKGLLAVTTNTGTATFDDVTIKGMAVITFDKLADQTYGNADVELPAKSTNTVSAINYSVDRPDIAAITAGKLHILKSGTVVVTASQQENDTFGAPANVSQTLVISKKDLQVKAEDQTRAYGKQNPPLGVSYTGFANTDDKLSLTTQPIASTTANSQSIAGVYQITVSGGASGNYNFVYTAGKLTITPAASNLKIAGTDVTCKGQNNGSITITATQTANYTAVVTSTGFDKTVNFETSTGIENLHAGMYSICVVDNALPTFKQCFEVAIAEPKDLSVYTSVNPEHNNVLLALSGGNRYDIKLNGASYHTTDNNITLPLNYGSNRLLISTDKDCQGIIERIVNLSGNTTPYPNPFREALYINIGVKKVAKTIIDIYDVRDGQLAMHKEFSNEAGVLTLDVGNLKKSVYTLRLTLDNKIMVYKIFNK